MGAFKAYDIRGIYPDEVNANLAYDVGKALVKFLKAKTLVVAKDMRPSSNDLYDALTKGILDSGCDVIDVGMISTPQFYFSLYTTDYDGGVMITASHNPKEYNGLKLCSKKADTIFQENGFTEIKKIIENKDYLEGEGKVIKLETTEKYRAFFKSKAHPIKQSFNILADTGNGMGIQIVDALRDIYGKRINIDVLFEELDGNFPNHECNPILPEATTTLREKLAEGKYDFGVAFDGDGDRVAFFLKDGTFIPPDLIVAILAPELAKIGDTVGYEVRTSQAVPKVLLLHGITPALYPVGRSYIINRMRKDEAVFGGEVSGHYFYKELSYTDSPLFTVINIITLLSEKTTSLEKLAEPIIDTYDRSGELAYKISDPDSVIAKIKEAFSPTATKILELDGLSVYTEAYFFNIRKSNTEPLVRLAIEGKGPQVVEEVKEKIEKIIKK